MISETEKFRQYLLSSLAEEEMEEVDLRIISDANLEAGLRRAENELMEDYLENTLTAEETRKFENEFLVNDERREHLEFLRLMKKRASEMPDVIPARAETERQPFSARIRRVFREYRAPVAVAAAVLILVGFLGVFYLATREITPSMVWESEIAQLNRQDLSDLNEQKTFSTLSLMPETFRSGDNAHKLDGEGITPIIFIRLGLPPDIQTKSVFDVKVYKNDAILFTLPGQSSYSNPNGQEMRLKFPREALNRGNYRIELQNGKDSPISYSFKVE